MYVDVMQVRNSEVLVFRQWMGVRRFGDTIETARQVGTYQGGVTKGVQKRIQKCITLLIQSSPKRRIWNPVSENFHDFQLSFTTLTIPDHGTDSASDIYAKCLAPFIRWARNKGMRSYVWKCELQARGAVHYHIAANVFMHYQDVQNEWNKHMKKAGYLQGFAKEHGHFRPNSVDVHAVYKVDDMERYLGKYLSKTGGTVVGKVWDASQNLKDSKYFSTELTPKNLEKLRKLAKSESKGEHCTYFRIPPATGIQVLDNIQRIEYQTHISLI